MNFFLQTLLLGVLISFLLFLIQTRRNRNKKLSVKVPPGPPRLPIIGNLFHFLTSCPHIYLHELSKTYGPIFSLRLGSTPTVVISSAKIAKEMVKTHDKIISDRPKFAALQKLSYNGSDVAFSLYNEQWRQLRKVSILHLFSYKKVKSFCSIREEEVHQMVTKISGLSDESKIVDLSETMISLANTVVCKVVFGRFGYTTCGRFISALEDAQQMFTMLCFSDFFPYMGWFDKLLRTSSHFDKVFMELDRFYEEIIDQHLKFPKVSGEGDIVDVLLDLQRDSSLGIDMTKDHIKGVLMNIFVGGTDTSAATVVWAMMELVKNPKSMKRAQQEVRSIIGRGCEDMVTEEDVGKLVYFNAVIKETFRLHPTVPLLVPRVTTQKCDIQGYEIEEKTLVYVNASTIGRDPESWENPDDFLPERFLGNCKDIDFRGQDFELIPFGIGRRICPGIHMGMAMVELALANLIRMFDWEVPDGMEDQVMDTTVLPGITTHKKIPLRLVAKKN